MNEIQKRQLAKLEVEGAGMTAAYKLGRQHQREIDAALCKSHRVYVKMGSAEKHLAPYIFDGDRHEGVLFSEAILANTGDK